MRAGEWTRRRMALALVPVIAAACVAGCSDDDGGAALPLSGIGLGTPGVNVTRTITETTPADVATVVVVIDVPVDEFDGPVPIDETAVIDALAAGGFERESIRATRPYDEGVEVRVDVDPALLPRVGEDIVRIVEEATTFGADDHGVVFSRSECAELVAELRKRAVAEARDEAALLAEAADIELGPVIGIADYDADYYFGFTSFGDRPSHCPTQVDPDSLLSSFGALEPEFESSYAPFDAPAEATVSVSLTVTFALGGMASAEGAPAAAISTTGRATVDGAADEAYLVAFVDIAGIDSAEELERDLADDLADYDIDDDDISVALGYDGIVQVRVPIDRLEPDGDDILDIIESATSSAYDSGVWFTTEACPDILGEARTAAFRDAQSQAEALAHSTGVALGAPVLVTDSSFDYLSVPPDRCRDLPADGASEGYPIGLASLDADPRVEIEVWLDVSFAITG